MSSRELISEQELKEVFFLTSFAVVFGKVFFVVVAGVAFTGFTRALGANDIIYSILLAMPVVGGVLQFYISYILERTGKRKLIFLTSAYVHRLIWIPIAIMPLVFPQSCKNTMIGAVIGLIIIYSIANSIVNMTYLSWMGDIIPKEMKGRFFSKRIAISTFTGIIAGIAVGKIMDINHGFIGFAFVFIGAAIFGVVDASCYIWVKDPMIKKTNEKISLLKLISEPFTNKDYKKLLIFMSTWGFACNFASPFFNVYMIEYIKMSYFVIALFTQIIGSVATVLFINYLGRLVDLFGNKPIMGICCIFLTLQPILWCFATSDHYIGIMLMVFLIGGIFEAGFFLTSQNLSIWIAPDQNRSMYLASYLIIVSIVGTAVPYIISGAFMQFSRGFIETLNIILPSGQKLNNYHALFILSSFLRILVLLVIYPILKEENSKKMKDVFKSFRVLKKAA